MSRYIRNITRYFFHHDVSGEHREEVYRRILNEDEGSLDDVFRDIWDDIPLGISGTGGSGSTAHIQERRRFRSFMRIAAIWIVPLCLTAIAAVMFLSSRSTDDGGVLRQWYARVGTVEKIVLPDSTVVWLNAGSVIVCPERFNDHERYAYIYGEGFFEVAKDSSRPFTVKTDNMDITVLGTSFNVNSYPGNIENTVTLEKGKVSVTLSDQRVYTLSPDEQLVYNCVSDRATVNKITASDFSIWRSGELFLCDLPFDEALSRIARNYGLSTDIRNQKYNKELVHVRFSKGESVDNVMSILQSLVPGMQYEIQDDTIVIE